MFKQNGATCHTASISMAVIRIMFPNRVISRNRFFAMGSNFHVINNEETSKNNNDKFLKVRLLYDILKNKCKSKNMYTVSTNKLFLLKATCPLNNICVENPIPENYNFFYSVVRVKSFMTYYYIQDQQMK